MPNRLIKESSPYLLQHAHNPVEWFPWGDEAFDKAKVEDKPVFLSIGYSTCHWCHVMEHESFENEEIAAYLNTHFVSIKLDREERPDLDDIYMTGVQIVSGQGGWPMSNFLNIEGKPFFAGTYYPPDTFLNLLQQLVKAWADKRLELEAQATKISNSIQQFTSTRDSPDSLPEDFEEVAAQESLNRLDHQEGGFGSAPKFPNESQLLLLLADVQRNKTNESLEAITLTLDKMYQGGIYDQIAGGFHRYTVDKAWLIPHFEKMLYNQGMLVRVYAQAYALTGKPAYKRIVLQTIAYLERDMQDKQGLFYAATDADSEGVEGKFFVWSEQALKEALSEIDFELVKDIYGITAEGNFEGNNILNLSDSLEAFASKNIISFENLLKQIAQIHQTLYQSREARIKPLRDEKVITAWNSMLLTSMVLASEYVGDKQILKSTESSAEALWQAVYKDQSLWRISVNQRVSIPANQEDYAYLAEAMLTLYQHSGNPLWLRRGSMLVEDMNKLFWDEEGGGYFYSLEDDAGPLITRPKSPMDGAMPSGNSVALSALVLLNEAIEDPQIENKIYIMIANFAGGIKNSPSAYAYMIMAIERKRRGSLSNIMLAASGHIRCVVDVNETETLVHLLIDEGWHINSSDAVGDTKLIATELHSQHPVIYPEALEGAMHGHITFRVKGFDEDLVLHFQACSEQLCLAPERIKLYPPRQNVH